ncbi:hypothetical protein Tco_0043490, partial [Tanacetum coccineum]
GGDGVDDDGGVEMVEVVSSVRDSNEVEVAMVVCDNEDGGSEWRGCEDDIDDVGDDGWGDGGAVVMKVTW